MINRLRDAGFDETTAGRAVIFATHFAMAVGRDMVMQNQLGGHPQKLLEDEDLTGSYEGIRGLVASGLNGPSDIGAQFDFELDVYIRGMERLLSA